MSVSHEIFQLRKDHKLVEALEIARKAYGADSVDIWIQRAYGWVLYDLVKRDVEAFERHEISPGELVNRFGVLIGEYRRFGENLRPDLLHSMLLTQVLKGSRIWLGFLDFALWWGPEYFRDEDRKAYEPPGGREMPSLALRYVYAVGREASHRATEIAPDLLAWAEGQVDVALFSSPDDQWLHYFKSKLLLDRGDSVKARECLLSVVRRQQRAAWVWTLLGQTHEKEDPEKAIVCYFRAVQLAGQPQEVANTRISLAHVLAMLDRFEEATLQVRRALEYRTGGGFRIPQALAQLVGTDWYHNLANRTDLPQEPDVADKADAILFGGERAQLNYRLGVVDNQNPDKAVAHAAFSTDEGAVLPYRHFKGIDALSVGDMLEVGLSEADGRAVRWRRCDARAIEGFCRTMTGWLSQREGQAFAFLVTTEGDRIFVHPALMAERTEHLVNGQTCFAMMGKDKNGKLGWRALRWISETEMNET